MSFHGYLSAIQGEGLQLQILALDRQQPQRCFQNHGGFIKATLAMLSKASGQENYSFLPIHGDPICLFDRDGNFVGRYTLGE